MTALSGEPWRGAARADHFLAATPANNYQACVTTDGVAVAPTGDQATWQGTPGGIEITLRFKWFLGGLGHGTAPTFASVGVFLPGGAQVGVSWNVPFPAAFTEVTRVMRFDLDPLDLDSADAIRAGTLEVFLTWGNSGGLQPWTVDSRGGGTPAALGGQDNARGYVRAPQTLTAESVSNVALGGAEPSPWAFPDTIFSRLTQSAQWYEAPTLTYSIRRGGGGAQERVEAKTQVAAVQEHTWAAVGGNTGRVGIGGMFAGSEVKDLRAALTAADFGGDNKFVWAAAGHDASWTRTSELQLDALNRITVDPRVTVGVQAEKDNVRTPGGNDDGPYVISADQLFLWALTQNARAENLAGLTMTQRIKRADLSIAFTDSSQVTGVPGWTPDPGIDATAAVVAPAGNRTQEAFPISPADAQGTGTQTIGMASAFTRNQFMAIAVPDEVYPGQVVTILAQLRTSAGLILPLDAAPSLRVFEIHPISGAESDILALGVMTQLGATNTWARSFTVPDGDSFSDIFSDFFGQGFTVDPGNVLIAEVRAQESGAGVEATEPFTARARFDPRERRVRSLNRPVTARM